MKVSRIKMLESLNHEDNLTNINEYIKQAKKLYKEEIDNYKYRKFSQSYNFPKKFQISSNSTRRTNPRLYNLRYTDENFNIGKKVKEIKTLANKSYQSTDPFMKNKLRVAFDASNADIVFEAKKQIADYKRKKASTLLNTFDSINEFYKEKKQTAIDNVIIKLLNDESKRLTLIDEENNKKVDNYNKLDIYNNNNFEDYSQQQKTIMKQIDKALNSIEDKYRDLLMQERNEKNIMNSITDEMNKKLHQMEDLRIYAQFVNDVLVHDKKFDYPLLRVDDEFLKTHNQIITTEDLVQITLKNYNFLIDPNNEEENNQILQLMEDPLMFIDEFHKIENKIIKALKKYEIKENEKKKVRNERNEIINELQKRYEFYNTEYLMYDKKLKKLIEEYSKIASAKLTDNSDIFQLIRELHAAYYSKDYNIIGTRIFFNRQNKMQIEEVLKEIILKCKNDERKINGYISNFEYYELHDPNFAPIIVQRKKDNKLFKLKNTRNKIDEELEAKNLVSKKKQDKVIIKYRQSLPPPFRLSKKDTSLDKDETKNKENKDLELLFY